MFDTKAESQPLTKKPKGCWCCWTSVFGGAKKDDSSSSKTQVENEKFPDIDPDMRVVGVLGIPGPDVFYTSMKKV